MNEYSACECIVRYAYNRKHAITETKFDALKTSVCGCKNLQNDFVYYQKAYLQVVEKQFLLCGLISHTCVCF